MVSSEKIGLERGRYSIFWESVLWRKPHGQLRIALTTDPHVVIAQEAPKLSEQTPFSVAEVEERLREDLLDQLDWQIHKRRANIEELQKKLAVEQAWLDQATTIKTNLLKEE